jgi:hypothetical protein
MKVWADCLFDWRLTYLMGTYRASLSVSKVIISLFSLLVSRFLRFFCELLGEMRKKYLRLISEEGMYILSYLFLGWVCWFVVWLWVLTLFCRSLRFELKDKWLLHFIFKMSLPCLRSNSKSPLLGGYLHLSRKILRQYLPTGNPRYTERPLQSTMHWHSTIWLATLTVLLSL